MNPSRVSVLHWPPNLQHILYVFRWMASQGKHPGAVEMTTRDWQHMIDQSYPAGGDMARAMASPPVYLHGVPLIPYHSGFPEGLIWIRDDHGQVCVELIHESVTEPMPTATLDPESYVHPIEHLPEVMEHLKEAGFTIFQFSRKDVTQLAQKTGYNGWLQERGYDPGSCEPVHFNDPEIALLVGALKRP